MTLRVPPPLVALVAALLIWIIARYLPTPLFVVPAINIIAGVIAACGLVVAVLGVVAFRRSQTSFDPVHPERATSLVTRGVYRYTRNPMYLGLALLLLAWALYLSAWLGVLVVGAFVAYMNCFQIMPEEKALESRFGQDFLRYQKAVRRWL